MTFAIKRTVSDICKSGVICRVSIFIQKLQGVKYAKNRKIKKALFFPIFKIPPIFYRNFENPKMSSDMEIYLKCLINSGGRRFVTIFIHELEPHKHCLKMGEIMISPKIRIFRKYSYP